MKHSYLSFILAAAIAAVSLCSCSSQDDNPTEPMSGGGAPSRETFITDLPIYYIGDNFTYRSLQYSFTVTKEYPEEVEISSCIDTYHKDYRLVIPKNIFYNGFYWSITSIGELAFDEVYGLVDITIPASIRKIGRNAFHNCYTLAKVYIAPGTQSTELSYDCFSSNSSLTDVDIPGNVPVIQGFRFCTSLVNVTLHEGSKEIYSSTFKNCTSLKEIHIPASIEKIGYGAFSGCTSLERVYIHGHPQIDDNAFPDTAQLIYD